MACVLHLGNITFADGANDEAVPSNDSSRAALGQVARLLDVEEGNLLTALTTRAITTVGARGALLAVAAHLGTTRLIDNLLIGQKHS